MNLKQLWGKIKSRPLFKIVFVLGLAGLVFVIFSPILSKLNLFTASTDLSPQSTTAEKRGLVMPPTYQPGYSKPLTVLVKPLFYVVLFVSFYYLLFNEKTRFNFKELLWRLIFALILIIFIFSSADLIRVVLRYFFKGVKLASSSYYYQQFARQLARRLSALILSFPLFIYFNYKLVKKSGVKTFTLMIGSLTGFFSLVLTYFLLNGLFMWILGVAKSQLVDYTLPLAYFPVLLPLSLLYLVVYLRKR